MKGISIVLAGLALGTLLSCKSGEDASSYLWRDEWDGPSTPGQTDVSITGKPRYVWIDASANFQYYGNDADRIALDCERIAEMGFTDIIVDVRPISGDVLFRSDTAPALQRVTAWTSSGYGFLERTADFDYLQTFLEAGHKAGLRVNAAINTMVGGYRTAAGDYGMMFDRPDRKAWGAVDNTPSGLVNTMDDPSNGPRFLDPAHPEVQEYLLSILRELASYQGLDGIVLDRCRYDDYNMDAGYTDVAKEAFAAYLGGEVTRWPLFNQGQVFAPSPLSDIQRAWLTFRVKTIHDFVSRAADAVHAVNARVRFGVYVGAWFSEYYRAGVNWASPDYRLKGNESSYAWVTDEYQSYGLADKLDFIFLGAYAGTSGVYGSGEWTMQGFAKLGRRRLAGAVPFAAGPDIGNGTGFDTDQSELIPDIVRVMLEEADGLFIFDLCHIRQHNYWNAFRKGIGAYLETLEQQE